jgi:hypothetical protein
LLAAGELVRILLFLPHELHQRQRASQPALAILARHLPDAERVIDVAGHRHVRPHGVRLKHHTHAPSLRRHGDSRRRVVHRAAGHLDAARRRHLEPRDHAQRRGLPAP